MLRQLHIQNLAIIEDLLLEPGAGLNVLSGETGAGKSIILESLGLLAGMKASQALVRSGERRATVEAVFELTAKHPVEALLKDLGLEGEESGEVLVRRDITSAGRGRAWINGRMVTLGKLTEVAALLLELHSQHEQQSLLSPAVQRDLYDDFRGLSAERAAVKTCFHSLQQANRDRDALCAEDRERAQRRDYLIFQIQEIEAMDLSIGELAKLEAECRRLSHAEDIRSHGEAVVGGLTESPTEEKCAVDLASRALAGLEEMALRDGKLLPLVEQLRSAVIEMEDVSREVVSYLADDRSEEVDIDDLNARIAALKRLLRKHGSDEEEALRRLAEFREELSRIDNWESTRADADRHVEEAWREFRAASAVLTEKRKAGANKFVRPLLGILKDFAMPKARLEVSFPPVKDGLRDEAGQVFSAHGAEGVEVLFSGNPGEPARPLRQVASGGELSRIMLALRNLSASGTRIPLLVFDEVDAGISGVAARCVGERLAALGRVHQVLCVTHNPAIASVGDHHILVEKGEDRGRTRTRATVVVGDEREGELARLLDGGRNSVKGLELAAQMLAQAV